MDTKTVQQRCVAGFVKLRSNRDGSTTFTVAGQRFTVSNASPQAAAFRGGNRALVRYEEGERNPKIVLVLSNPTSLLIRQHQEQCQS